MAFILNIDTAVDKASFCIANNNEVLIFDEQIDKTRQAAWLHTAIQQALKKLDIPLQHMQAIAVSNGPGSYTGLRIGLATAKGMCYALQIPLICHSTLFLMAAAVQPQAAGFICPMIDARRMEVFTALYNNNLGIEKEPYAEILSTNSFADILQQKNILFTGNGMPKSRQVITHSNAQFLEYHFSAKDMVRASLERLQKKQYNDVAYTEPFYIKDVYIK